MLNEGQLGKGGLLKGSRLSTCAALGEGGSKLRQGWLGGLENIEGFLSCLEWLSSSPVTW